VLSILVQLPLAYFLGHPYDQRIFLATGYVAGSGFDPYKPILLMNVFSVPDLNGAVPVIGYPPPWPLMLGFTYLFFYRFASDVFLYNFATKIPIIVANIILAYLVKKILVNFHVDEKRVRFAWLFLLFNPFTLLTTTAWGQIDSIAAVLCVASLFLLSKGSSSKSGFLLGASIAVKPVASALAPLPLLFSERFFSKKNLWYTITFSTAVLALWLAPFFLFGWHLPSTLQDVNGRFGNAGGLNVFNLVELIQGTTIIPNSLWFIDYLWVPALLVGYYFVYRNPPRSAQELVLKSIGLILLFFLTRVWLSEPNINLLIPLVLITAGLQKIGKRNLLLFFIIPFIFLVVNTTVLNFFFLVNPSVLVSITQFNSQYGVIRYSAKFVIAILWALLGWHMVFQMFKGSGTQKFVPAKSSC
jgi:hypothetical protein